MKKILLSIVVLVSLGIMSGAVYFITLPKNGHSATNLVGASTLQTFDGRMFDDNIFCFALYHSDIDSDTFADNYSIEISPTTDKSSYLIGENILLNVEFKNTGTTDATTTYNVAVILYAEKYWCVSMRLDVWNNYILSDNGSITIPAGESINLSYTLSSSDYETNGHYIVKGWISEDCMGFTEFAIHSGLEISAPAPSDVNPNENFNVSLSIKNILDRPVENITVNARFPRVADVSGPTSFEIPVLSPGESSTTTWVMSTSYPWGGLTPIFRISTNNSFNHSDPRINVIHPIELDIVSSSVVYYSEKLGEPLETGFKVRNIGDLDATDVSVSITLPEDVTATNTTWDISNLPGKGEAILRTDLTFTETRAYYIIVSASDSAGHTASGAIWVDII